MRLTVGPHPAAVYWRRRAVVLVGLAIVTLIVVYACSGTSSSGAEGPHATATPTTPTTTILHPFIATPLPTTTPPTPTPTPYTLPLPVASGPCTDDEIGLTASADPASAPQGTPVSFTITIKNISTRSCARDIGAEPQTLLLLDATGTTTIWSSDDCNNNHSSDVETLAPGATRSFTLTWNGNRSRSGSGQQTCTDATPVDPGNYELVARLDKKMSAPFILHLI
jgi:hypothetical protein